MSLQLPNIGSGFNRTALNQALQGIEDELNNNTLRRNGLEEGEDNSMQVDLDMNSNYILNSPEPVEPTHLVRLQDLENFTVDSGTQTVAHLNDYLTEGATVEEALVAACRDVNTVLFGGLDITLSSDFVYPSDGICRKWDLQDAIIRTENNSQFLFGDVQDSFQIVGNGAEFYGGLKRAKLSADFVPDGTNQTFQVEPGHGFEVGDNISSSWDNFYLTNSLSRVGAGFPLTGLPEVIGTTSTTITVRYPGATNEAIHPGRPTIPEGAELFNARFDLRNFGFSGSGVFHFSGFSMYDLANAYAVLVDDPTESARVYFEQFNLERSALDSFKFRASRVCFVQSNINRLEDIGKQVVVWSNENSFGNLAFYQCRVTPNNVDSFVFAIPDSGNEAYQPNLSIKDSFFDGKNERDFTLDSQFGLDAFNFVGFFPNNTDIAYCGKVTCDNSDFRRIKRHLFGSTFSPIDTMEFKDITLNNCISDCDPFFSSAPTSNEPRVNVVGGQIRANNFRLNNGSVYGVYDNTTVTENFPTESEDFFTEAGATTTRKYKRGSYILRTDNGNKYEVIDLTVEIGESIVDGNTFQKIGTEISSGVFSNGTRLLGDLTITGSRAILDEVRLPKRLLANNETKVSFGSQYGESLGGKVILEGFDNTLTTSPDLRDWFTFASQDAPNLNFRFEFSTIIGEVGGTEGPLGEDEYHLLMKSTRTKEEEGGTAPLPMVGAFSYNPPVNSVVKGIRDRGSFLVKGRSDFTVTSSALEGSSTITGTPSGNANIGDWISVNEPGSPDVHFYEIVGISGSDYSVRPNLSKDLTISANCKVIKFLPYDINNEPLYAGVGDPETKCSWSHRLVSYDVDGIDRVVTIPDGHPVGTVFLFTNIGTGGLNLTLSGSEVARGPIDTTNSDNIVRLEKVTDSVWVSRQW